MLNSSSLFSPIDKRFIILYGSFISAVFSMQRSPDPPDYLRDGLMRSDSYISQIIWVVLILNTVNEFFSCVSHSAILLDNWSYICHKIRKIHFTVNISYLSSNTVNRLLFVVFLLLPSSVHDGVQNVLKRSFKALSMSIAFPSWVPDARSVPSMTRLVLTSSWEALEAFSLISEYLLLVFEWSQKKMFFDSILFSIQTR